MLNIKHHIDKSKSTTTAIFFRKILECVLAWIIIHPPSAIANPDNIDTVQQQLLKTQSQLNNAIEERDSARGTAEKINKERVSLRLKMITTARQIQQAESTLSAHENHLRELRGRYQKQMVAFKEKYQHLTGALAAIEKLSQNPNTAFFLHPGKPSDAVQSSMVLNYIVGELDNRTKKVRQDLKSLNLVRTQVLEKTENIRTQIASLDSRRLELESLSDKKSTEMQRAIALSKKRQSDINTLSQKTKSLQDLIITLEEQSMQEQTRIAKQKSKQGKKPTKLTPTDKPQADPQTFAGRTFPKRGGLIAPAHGKISSRFHQIDELGQRTTGIRVQTRHNAQVVAPYDGKVVFTGHYAKYGNMIIIKHSGGYYSILAGMDNPDAFNGQWLLAGEPIGTMGTLAPELYIEIRRKDRAVNPLNWISTKSIASRG